MVGSASDPFTLNVVAGDYSDSALGDLGIACKASDDFTSISKPHDSGLPMVT